MRISSISGRHFIALSALSMTAALSGSVAGCSNSNDEDSGPSSSPDCVSTREYFTTEVYGKAMQVCTGCHTPGGQADQKGAKFKIYRDTWPDFVSANLTSLRSYVRLELDGKPLILVKPLGGWDHGGGQVLTEDSNEYKILSGFVNDLRAGNEKTCNGDGQLGVTLMEPHDTARKAALTLAGRYPTDDEFAAAGTDEGLDAFVEKLTREELFYDRLREIWNDALLTERGLDSGAASAYDNAPELYDDKYPGYTQVLRQWASLSMTQEPMRYIEYVVRNDLPFSDVVAGNYVVANPYIAKLYGLPHDKPLAPESFLEWKRIDFSPVQNNVTGTAVKTAGVPVAGVLTTPAFLNRWETTRTNKSRKRARIVLKNFLATDIFKFAQRPVDSTALTSVQNPTSNSAMCSVCHTVVDPIAGGFRGFDENTLTRFTADDKWHDDMLPPGINNVQMPPQNYGNAAMWLGAQIPTDPRFGIAVAQVMYRGIVGDDPLGFPQDKDDPTYTDHVRAYNVQNDWFVKVGNDFVAAKFDLRKLVVAIVKSTYFRAKTAADPTKNALHDGLGPGRLLGPEMLGRKLRATTGFYFYTNTNASADPSRGRDSFLNSDFVTDRDWRLVYGGIDSGDVTKRTETMSPIMLATSQYAASLVACRATAFDFSKPQAARRLFRKVEMTTTPFTPRATKDAVLGALPESEPKIREQIKDLYYRFLGETVETDSADVNDAYALFLDVWKDLEQTNNDQGNGTGMSNYRCIADVDYDAPVQFIADQNGYQVPTYPKLRDRPDKAPYEPGMRLDRDENFSVRAWQAVLTYLLMDYRFTHE